MTDLPVRTASPAGEAVSVSTLVSLCSGVGALDLAVEAVFGATTIAVCEFDADPSRVLAARFPDVPNLGDLKTLAWAGLRPRILAAGYPCQPFSNAGKRLGTDDPRHLYPWISQGIERCRPELVALENVRGHYRRGWSIVVADLDRLDYDVRWLMLHAADVGAPHPRARLFALARAREVGGWPAPTDEPIAVIDPEGDWLRPDLGLFGAVPYDEIPPTFGVQVGGVVWSTLPLPLPLPLPLLPTPAVNDMGARKTPEEWDAWTARMQAEHGNGNGHGNSLAIETLRLLPTPEAKLSDSGPDYARADREGSGGDDLTTTVHRFLLPTPKSAAARTSRSALLGTALGSTGRPGGQWSAPALDQALELARGELPREFEDWSEVQGWHRDLEETEPAGPWGPYEPAVRRWEALTRPAPPPTQPGTTGTAQLSPRFVEWMMGWPDGWVTEPTLWPGMTAAAARNAMLKACGNGVVIRQAAAAFRMLAADVLPLT